MSDTDLAIIGSGFGGSIMAMVARRLGARVTLIERGRHPRFAIGESASPLAGILIEQLSDRYDLARLRPLSTFGAWQRAYPHVVCGLKRGFTFFEHKAGARYCTAADRSNQLLVAASPSEEQSDTHWLRSDVDQLLVNEAIALGVDFQDLVELDALEWRPSGDAMLVGARQRQPFRLRARFVIDASGPRGFLSSALGIDNRGFAAYPGTQALFSHFTGVARCEDVDGYAATAGSSLPYPMDDAALHHVFEGGWMWVLRFGNGVTSAGVAVEDWLADEVKLGDGEPAWHRLLARYPSVAAQFADARLIRPFTWLPKLAYRAAAAAGERWAMLPSAAAFIDPLLSTGIPLTLLGIERLARVFESGLPCARPDSGLERYAAATLEDADRTARFIAGSYAGFRRFPMFTAYSMFYFAAASFSEMARRLGSSRTPQRFLCGDSDRLASALDRLSPAVWRDDGGGYAQHVASAVDEWNVAGLCDAGKHNWYGIDVEDTVRGASKLGLRPEQVRAALRTVLDM